MKLPAIVFAFVLFCSVSVFSQVKNYGASDSEITASIGEQFTITLASNHTTGYSWSAGMVADNSEVVVLNVSYKTSESPKTGEGGDEIWHFKAFAPGTVKIKMYYARPWENEKPAQEIIYTVTVK
jgi:inhibitor of cysteine peptidase